MLIYFNAISCFADLKSYFSQGSSSTQAQAGSTPSTHGSGVGLEALEVLLNDGLVVNFYFRTIYECSLEIHRHT